MQCRPPLWESPWCNVCPGYWRIPDELKTKALNVPLGMNSFTPQTLPSGQGGPTWLRKLARLPMLCFFPINFMAVSNFALAQLVLGARKTCSESPCCHQKTAITQAQIFATKPPAFLNAFNISRHVDCQAILRAARCCSRSARKQWQRICRLS